MFEIDGRLIRASFGTTKYCSFFLKGLQCKNKECLYMHSSQKSSKILTKEMMSSRAIYQEQEKIAFQLAEIENYPYEEFITSMKKYSKGVKPVFPAAEYIYHKKFFFLDSTLYECQLKNALLKKQSELAVKSEKASKLEIPMINKPIIPLNNKFKFIKLVSNDDNCHSTLINEDGQLDNLLDEMHLQERNEYAKYQHIYDSMAQNYTTKHNSTHITPFNGTPIYSLGYQQINSNKAESYTTSDESGEWKKEQYHFIKQLLSNTNGRWLFEELRSLKRKNKFDGRVAEKSTSSSAHSRKEEGQHSDEEPIVSLKMINIKKDINLKTEKKSKKSKKLGAKARVVCG